MNPHPLSFLLVAFSLSSATAFAQGLEAPFPLPRVVSVAQAPGGERLYVTYDVEQDRITDVRSRQSGTIGLGAGHCFDNAELSFDDLANYFVTPNPGEELVDWGTKTCRSSGLLRSITIGYGSSANDVGRIQFALYTGTQGFGQLGREVFRRTITGLPVTGGSHSPIFLTIDFGTRPLALPDGPIGWGFLQLDGHTGPFLVRAPRPVVGTADALDLYAGPASSGEYQGTFNYGGCSSPFFGLCASMWIQLEEVPQNEVASSAILNGSGANPIALEETLPARLGELWAARIDTFGLTGTVLPTLLFTSSAPFGPQASPYGEILIDPDQQIRMPQVGGIAYFAEIPADPGLVGHTLYLQGAVLKRTGAFLTNALRVRVGY